MKRICFLSPDVTHARNVVNILKRHDIPEKHIYVIAKEGVSLEELPDSGPESNDFIPAYERGLAVGGAGGVLAGLLALAFPSGLVIGGGTILLLGLYGAGLGGLLTGIAGASFPSSRLRCFEEEIEQGKLLVLADLPKRRAAAIERDIKTIDPTTELMGVEPAPPLVP